MTAARITVATLAAAVLLGIPAMLYAAHGWLWAFLFWPSVAVFWLVGMSLVLLAQIALGPSSGEKE